MLQLTSYQRMLRYLGNSEGTQITASKNQEREINNWIISVSKQIEKYLNRNLAIESRTEYFNLHYGQTQFFPSAPPITTLTSVYEDTSGLWDGTSESLLDDCYIGVYDDSVIIPTILPYEGKKLIRIIYTGGMAYSGVQSVFGVTVTGGSLTVGNYVYGSTSGAGGIVKVASATSLTIEILWGIFEEDETVTEYSDSGFTTTTSVTATLDSITRRSLVEVYPDIVRAAEMQIRYDYKHKHDFELTSTNKDGTNTRSSGPFIPSAQLTQEVQVMLMPYQLKSL